MCGPTWLRTDSSIARFGCSLTSQSNSRSICEPACWGLFSSLLISQMMQFGRVALAASWIRRQQRATRALLELGRPLRVDLVLCRETAADSSPYIFCSHAIQRIFFPSFRNGGLNTQSI